MQIVLNIPFAFAPESNRVANAEALRALLDCMVALNLAYLKTNAAPALYRSGVVYGRTTVWETIPAVLARGYGDCKSLATWLIAEYRSQGKQANPTFRWNTNPAGGTDFHILVLTDKGFEDPSKVLGMGQDENRRY